MSYKYPSWDEIIDLVAEISNLPEVELQSSHPLCKLFEKELDEYEECNGVGVKTLVTRADLQFSVGRAFFLLEKAWVLAQVGSDYDRAYLLDSVDAVFEYAEMKGESVSEHIRDYWKERGQSVNCEFSIC